MAFVSCVVHQRARAVHERHAGLAHQTVVAAERCALGARNRSVVAETRIAGGLSIAAHRDDHHHYVSLEPAHLFSSEREHVLRFSERTEVDQAPAVHEVDRG